MHKVVLMLGSNQGDRESFLRQAREYIFDRIGNILTQSSVYESEAMGYESQNRYLNQALSVETELEPEEVLAETQKIEKKLGRVRSQTERYTDRTIDIDILFFDDIILKSEHLVIPHPEIASREFVLRPVTEVIPQFKHPVSGESMTEMLKKIKKI